MTNQKVAVWYYDNVIYPDKVRLNCYYYRYYSFIKDIQMILCTVHGKKIEYAGEVNDSIPRKCENKENCNCHI